MADEKKELLDGELEAVGGGAAVHKGLRITTALSPGCSHWVSGSNFYNRETWVPDGLFGGCAGCVHLERMDGWHVCNIPGNY